MTNTYTLKYTDCLAMDIHQQGKAIEKSIEADSVEQAQKLADEHMDNLETTAGGTPYMLVSPDNVAYGRDVTLKNNVLTLCDWVCRGVIDNVS